MIKVLLEDKLIENARTVGNYLLDQMKERLLPFPFVGDVRGKGLLLGVEIVKDKKTKEPYPVGKHMAENITQILVKKGIIVYPGTGNADGINGDQFLVAPPLITTKSQADDIVKALVAGFTEVQRESI